MSQNVSNKSKKTLAISSDVAYDA
jgi:hypothetical protein